MRSPGGTGQPARPADGGRPEAEGPGTRRWIPPALLIALAALLRAAYLIAYARRIPFYNAPIVDARIYDLWARTIAAGDWVGRTEGVFYRAPLYPYLLAIFDVIFGRPVPSVFLFQLLLGSAIVALSGLLAARMAGRGAALWAMLLLILYGPLVAADSKLLATTLGIFLQLLALWLSLRAAERPSRRRSFAAGAVLGFGALVRPQWLMLAAVIPVALEWPLRRPAALPGESAANTGRADSGPPVAWPVLKPALRRWAPFAVGVALVILPVTLRNLIVGKDLVLISSNGGMTFFQGNNEENHSGLLTIVKKFELFGSATDQRMLETQVAEREMGRSLKPSETSAFWTRQATQFIFGHPVAWLELEGQKLFRVVTSYEYADNYSYYIERDRLWPLRLAFLPFGLLLALGFLGARFGAGEPRARRLAWTSAAFGILGCLAFYVSSRYRMEAVPGLAILGGAGLARLPSSGRGLFRPAPRPGPWAWVLSAMAIVAVSCLPAGAPARSQESISYLQLGNALETSQHFREAEQAYRRSIEDLPVNVYAWDTLVLLVSRLDGFKAADSLLATAPSEAVGQHPLTLYTRGYLRTRLGRDDEAIADLEAAVKGNPLMKEAHAHLAYLLERHRDYDRAARELEETFRLDPKDADVLAHLVYVRIQLRRYPEALEAARNLLQLRPEDTDAEMNLAIAGFYLGRFDEAEAALDHVVSRTKEKAPENGDPLVHYYLGLIHLRKNGPVETGRDPMEELGTVLRAEPQNQRAAWYYSLACAREAPERLAAFCGPIWTGEHGPVSKAFLPALLDLIRDRSGTPWGEPLDSVQEAALRRLATSPDGAALASDLRRYFSEEAPAPRSP